jgi:hypothetical protein
MTFVPLRGMLRSDGMWRIINYTDGNDISKLCAALTYVFVTCNIQSLYRPAASVIPYIFNLLLYAGYLVIDICIFCLSSVVCLFFRIGAPHALTLCSEVYVY